MFQPLIIFIYIELLSIDASYLETLIMRKMLDKTSKSRIALIFVYLVQSYPSFPPDRTVRRSDCILAIFNKNSVQFKYIFCLLLFGICGHRYARYGMKTNQKSLLFFLISIYVTFISM